MKTSVAKPLVSNPVFNLVLLVVIFFVCGLLLLP
jgi:hypothetical protein